MPAAASPALERSADSLAFEAHWRNLTGTRRMPDRADFRPEKAARFLPDIALLEIRLTELPRMRIRLVGTAIEARIQAQVLGRDYLDFVPETIRAAVEESTRQIFDFPCGLWQLMPVHYERGIAQYIEMTALPLAAGNTDVPLLVIHIKFPEQRVTPMKVTGIEMLVQTATAFSYLDTGHGVPA